MKKIDFKKAFPKLYGAPTGAFVTIDVPPVQFVSVDGRGDPNSTPAYGRAIQWLYSVSYAMKFATKGDMGRDYVVPPLEGLWWSDDPADFVTRRKDRWRWTLMILAPDFLDGAYFDAAVTKARKKLGEPPDSLRLERLNEGLCLQTMHIGSYDAEGPVLARLHDEILPAQGLIFAGHHHEIYLSDARKTMPDKLKTILRQPVKFTS